MTNSKRITFTDEKENLSVTKTFSLSPNCAKVRATIEIKAKEEDIAVYSGEFDIREVVNLEGEYRELLDALLNIHGNLSNLYDYLGYHDRLPDLRIIAGLLVNQYFFPKLISGRQGLCSFDEKKSDLFYLIDEEDEAEDFFEHRSRGFIKTSIRLFFTNSEFEFQATIKTGKVSKDINPRSDLMHEKVLNSIGFDSQSPLIDFFSLFDKSMQQFRQLATTNFYNSSVEQLMSKFHHVRNAVEVIQRNIDETEERFLEALIKDLIPEIKEDNYATEKANKYKVPSKLAEEAQGESK